jgi:hypothetical protein
MNVLTTRPLHHAAALSFLPLELQLATTVSICHALRIDQ